MSEGVVDLNSLEQLVRKEPYEVVPRQPGKEVSGSEGKPPLEAKKDLALQAIKEIRREQEIAEKAVESLKGLEVSEEQCGTVEADNPEVVTAEALVEAVYQKSKDSEVNEQLKQLYKADNPGVEGEFLSSENPLEAAVMKKYEDMKAALQAQKAELAKKGALCSNAGLGGSKGGSRKRKRSKKRKGKGNKTRKNAQNNNNNNTTRRRKKTARRKRTKRA